MIRNEIASTRVIARRNDTEITVEAVAEHSSRWVLKIQGSCVRNEGEDEDNWEKRGMCEAARELLGILRALDAAACVQ